MFRRKYFLLIFVLIAACDKPAKQVALSGETMGTTYKVVVVDENGALDSGVVASAVESTLDWVNSEYSNWNSMSEVSRFSALQSSDVVAVSEGFSQMLDLAMLVHDASDGQFDVTVGPLIDLWGFGADGTITQAPDEAEISLQQERVGQARVLEVMDAGRSLRKVVPEAEVNLTAMAKGFGIDAVADALVELGAKDFMVEIGGDLYVSGQTVRDSDWLIGIERPDAPMQSVERVVALSGVGMATSGDYRNYFEQDGVRFSHIIDATTGRPITHRTASVTVVAKNAMVADAWATALLVVGAERGLEIAEAQGLDVLFIVRQETEDQTGFTTITTSGFDRFLRFAKD